MEKKKKLGHCRLKRTLEDTLAQLPTTEASWLIASTFLIQGNFLEARIAMQGESW